MPAKKAAKKAAAKHADSKHHEAKDLRRAYEHLGHVEILQGNLSAASSKDIHTLVTLAEKELGKGHRKDAADLLRAAEHFSFAALTDANAKPGKISEELEGIVAEEVEHLTERANEHWDEREESEHHASVTTLFRTSLETAASALKAGRYRQALELARGSEALAHVKKHGAEELGAGTSRLKLPNA